MRAISQGDSTYDIFDDSLRVYEQLPAQSYVVRCSERRGFYLSKYVEMGVTESKVYGVHEEKVNKVLTAFEEMNRSLGVILSGDKGIGKSLFAKMLAVSAIANNIPVIVVDKYINGIASYIESIEQEVMILFDEFDKTFGEVRAKDGESSPQTDLLTLFDGLSGGKKLFVVTCNELRKLNEYLINRPGRFHYHFRFEYPSAQEIRQYLHDKLNESYYEEINDVVAFAGKVSLNYDCLRSIAFELNHGLAFTDAIRDLNIINTEAETYRVTMRYANGLVVSNKAVKLDLFSGDEDPVTIWMYDRTGNNLVDVTFSPASAVYDARTGGYIIMPDDLRLSYDDDDDDSAVKAAKESKAEYLSITRKVEKSLHYMV
ncbi:MAG: AAA family ATPase [Ruminococcus flavefaciens]|nr:AAA family ATPase [Ruminococcus flavefaciens]